MSSLLLRLSRLPRIEYLIAATGVLLSLLFTFVLFGSVGGQLGMQLDPEWYGSLGTSIWKNGILAYYPDTTPTVFRGPTYPLLIAALLAISDGWYPHVIQIAQAFLFGITILAVFAAAERLWDRRAATAAALLCALHPLIIGFTGKVVLEPLVMALFTLLVATMLKLAAEPTLLRSVAVGALVGTLALAKGTYLPFVAIIPLYLLVIRDRRIRNAHIATMAAVALVMIGAWMIRNGNVSGKYSPSQALTGYNLRRGDMNIDQILKPPFLGDHFWRLTVEEIDTMGAEFTERWRADWYRDSVLTARTVARYREDPGFMATKVLFNSVAFWILGDSPAKTAVYALFQIPLVIAFAVAARRRIRSSGIRSIEALQIALVVLYFLAHLPIFAFFRLSSVLIPVMIVYASGLVGERKVERRTSYVE